MGYYTEFKFKAKLRSDTPEEVIDLFKDLYIDGELDWDDKGEVIAPMIHHNFFGCERWYMLLLSNNFDPERYKKDICFDGRYWNISIHSEFKNYDGEIDEFLDWITPYVVGRKKKKYVGFRKGENHEDPMINLYLDLSKNEKK